MTLTRRQLVAGAAGAAVAVGAAGIYEMVDRMTSAPARSAAGPLPPEQHLLDGLRVVHDNDVEVIVPPLHHQVITLRLNGATSKADLLDARAELEAALTDLNRRYPNTPAGLGVTVAWGMPYFERYVPGAAAAYLPIDRRASQATGKQVGVLIDAVRFPSDPGNTVLESNDAVILLRSDHLDHIADGADALAGKLQFWNPTSIRRGFAGGGFEGGPGLPKQMAVAASVPGAHLIPDGSELFLGFTSTQKANLGPSRIANIEQLGYSDGGRDGYFRQGTAMHLSHIFEDLENWYLTFDHNERVSTVFRPGKQVPAGTLTVRQGPQDVATVADNKADYAAKRAIGHSAVIQTASRLAGEVRGADGTVYPKGTAVPQRADFNTLDNPFFLTTDPQRDGAAEGAAAGVHFLVFTPTADDFHRNRLAMDGVLPDGTKLEFTMPSRGQGFNAVLSTTHRQNYLVPPRRHRSFPLAEKV